MKTIEVYFDYVSPWSYLAFAIMEREIPALQIDYRPFYLRGLESFSKGMPYTADKLSYMARDFARCTEHHDVTFAPPANFPLDGLQALRGALVAKEHGAFERYHRAAFAAAWREQKDISKKEVIAALLADAIGGRPAEHAASLASQAIKDRLREETTSAIDRGVFGAPTFFVGDEMFWGHDRLDYVLRAATRPPLVRHERHE